MWQDIRKARITETERSSGENVKKGHVHRDLEKDSWKLNAQWEKGD